MKNKKELHDNIEKFSSKTFAADFSFIGVVNDFHQLTLEHYFNYFAYLHNLWRFYAFKVILYMRSYYYLFHKDNQGISKRNHRNPGEAELEVKPDISLQKAPDVASEKMPETGIYDRMRLDFNILFQNSRERDVLLFMDMLMSTIREVIQVNIFCYFV